jgi:hypothetical protein
MIPPRKDTTQISTSDRLPATVFETDKFRYRLPVYMRIFDLPLCGLPEGDVGDGVDGEAVSWIEGEGSIVNALLSRAVRSISLVSFVDKSDCFC